MKTQKQYIFTFLLVIFAIASAQVSFTRNYFYDLQTYKLLDFDFENGGNNPNFFSYTLSYRGDEPTQLVMEATFTATLPAFGFQNVNLVHVRTKPFEFLGSITLSSLDIDQNVDKLYYDGTEDEIVFHGNEIEEFIEESEFNKIRDNVLATGELPVGQYVFNIAIYKDGSVVGSDQKVISISSSSSLELIEPGGELADMEVIHTTFPIFRWDTDPVRYNEDYCDDCGIFIRVSEYDSVTHQGSMQAALTDKSSLPFDNSKEFVKLAAINTGNNTSETVNSFMYPISGAKPLEPGHAYVWQIKKKFPSTSGVEEIESPIYIFKIAEEQGNETTSEESAIVNNMIFKMIETLAPDNIEEFQSELQGYQFSGDILLGNQTISSDELQNIINELSAKNYELETIIVK